MCGSVSWASCLPAGGQLLIVTQMISAALTVCVCQLGSNRLVSFIAADTHSTVCCSLLFSCHSSAGSCANLELDFDHPWISISRLSGDSALITADRCAPHQGPLTPFDLYTFYLYALHVILKKFRLHRHFHCAYPY